MLVRVMLALVFAAVAASCAPEPFEFVCESDVQCDERDDGICAQMWCSYPDDACDSGLRFSENAAAEQRGECVDLSNAGGGSDG